MIFPRSASRIGIGTPYHRTPSQSSTAPWRPRGQVSLSPSMCSRAGRPLMVHRTTLAPSRAPYSHPWHIRARPRRTWSSGTAGFLHPHPMASKYLTHQPAIGR